MTNSTRDQTKPTKYPRRWFAFSLRTLLLVLSVLAVWIGMLAERARRQREFVAEVHRVGGNVLYDFQRTPDGSDLVFDTREPPLDSRWGWPILDEPPEPKWLIDLLGIDFFHHVVDAGFDVDLVPDWEEPVQEGDRRIDDEWLAKYLPRAPKLGLLELRETAITDKGLTCVVLLRLLDDLDLGWTRIGDKGVTQLTKLKLEALYLDGTRVSDASIPVLSQMHTLTTLRIDQTDITEQGATKLRESLPNCDIWFSE